MLSSLRLCNSMRDRWTFLYGQGEEVHQKDISLAKNAFNDEVDQSSAATKNV